MGELAIAPSPAVARIGSPPTTATGAPAAPADPFAGLLARIGTASPGSGETVPDEMVGNVPDAVAAAPMATVPAVGMSPTMTIEPATAGSSPRLPLPSTPITLPIAPPPRMVSARDPAAAGDGGDRASPGDTDGTDDAAPPIDAAMRAMDAGLSAILAAPVAVPVPTPQPASTANAPPAPALSPHVAMARTVAAAAPVLPGAARTLGGPAVFPAIMPATHQDQGDAAQAARPADNGAAAPGLIPPTIAAVADPTGQPPPSTPPVDGNGPVAGQRPPALPPASPAVVAGLGPLAATAEPIAPADALAALPVSSPSPGPMTGTTAPAENGIAATTTTLANAPASLPMALPSTSAPDVTTSRQEASASRTAPSEMPAVTPVRTRRSERAAADVGRAQADRPDALQVSAVAMPAAASPDATTAPLAVATAPADAAMARDLAVAQDGQWLDTLARDIAQSAGSGNDLHFRLQPQHLGTLNVSIAQRDDGAAIRMTADSEATRDLLVDSQPRLLAEARAQGLRISETRIDMGQGNSGQNATSQGGNGQSGNAQSGNGPPGNSTGGGPSPGNAGSGWSNGGGAQQGGQGRSSGNHQPFFRNTWGPAEPARPAPPESAERYA